VETVSVTEEIAAAMVERSSWSAEAGVSAFVGLEESGLDDAAIEWEDVSAGVAPSASGSAVVTSSLAKRFCSVMPNDWRLIRRTDGEMVVIARGLETIDEDDEERMRNAARRRQYLNE